MVLQSGEVCKFSDKFDVEYDDDGHFTAVSKKTFRHEDDELTFDYKYVIEIVDMKAYGDGNDIYAELYLMPTPEALHPHAQEQIMSFCGVDEIGDISYMDMIAYGGSGVSMAIESWKDEEAINPLEDEKCKQVLDNIATLFESIDRMRGFYIDKCWNVIGSTGWDVLRNAILNEELFPMLKK